LTLESIGHVQELLANYSHVYPLFIYSHCFEMSTSSFLSFITYKEE
jgi:hypothetical protein